MGILQNIKRAWKVASGKAKYFEDEDGLGIALRDLGSYYNFSDGSWGKTKQLQAYQKSLYVFRCVKKIAQKTASVDWELFKIRNRVGDTVQIFVHEALDLLYRPNPFQTKSEFFEKYMINKLLTGQAFVLKVRDDRGNVVELWNLRPDYVTIVKDPQAFIKGYEFTKNDGQRTVFAPEDVIYDAEPAPLDDWGGLSILQASEVRVETEEFATKYQRYFFRNNARPDFILSSDDKIGSNQKEEIKKDWDRRHKGVLNAGRGAFLEMGLKYQQVSISQREMDYIESLKMTRDDILTAFAVPKPIIAITEDVNYANAKTAMDIFLMETIEPEIKRITEKLNEHLVYPEYGDIFYIDYDRSFLPKNEKEIADTNAVHLASGVKLINEVREEMGLDPIIGGWSLYMPLSNIAVGGLPQKGVKKSIGPDKRKIFTGRGRAYKFLKIKEEIKETLYKEIRSAVKREGSKAQPLIKADIRKNYAEYVIKAIDGKASAFKPAIEKFAGDQADRFIKELAHKQNSLEAKAIDGMFNVPKENKLFAEMALPFIQEFVESAGKDAMQTIAPAEQFTITERIQRYIKERSKELARQVNSTTVDKLSRTLAEGIGEGEGIAKLTERVNSVYEEFPVYRAETIARTEATGANNKGFIESYGQSGVANAKEWIATFDTRTRDSHAEQDGEIVGLDETFSNGLDYPGDPSGDPAETIHCRCVIGPAFQE